MGGQAFDVLTGIEPKRWSELIAQVAKRDERALEQLYSETKGAVFGFALRVVGDQGEAEEITMDVYLRVWERASQYSEDRGSVMTWLFVMTRSRALDRIRRKAVRVSSWLALDEIQIPARPGTGPDSVSELSIMKNRVDQVLAGLPPAHRQAVELALFEGMSHSEIAKHLAQPVGTVKSRIRSSMTKIRDAVRA